MRLIRKAFLVWRAHGMRKVVELTTRKVGSAVRVRVSYPFKYLKPISEIDPFDTASLPRPRLHARGADRLSLRWYMPAPGRGSGGHLNLFRIIEELARRGHRSEVALLEGPLTGQSQAKWRAFIKEHFRADVDVVWDSDPQRDVDLVLATTWVSAYTAVRDTACAARAYVVQDWEPDFHARGSESIFAENSYRLGFHHITAGPWLADRLRGLGASASHFPFAADPDIYYPVPVEREPGKVHIVFYARPVTPRRCYELGVEALRLLNERLGRGRLVASFAGWPIAPFPADFTVRRRGILPLDQLRALYSSADAVLVLSSTNPSLLPLEVALCGVPVVDLALDSVKGTIKDGISARLAPPSPPALAAALADLVAHPEEARALADRARRYALTCTWEATAVAVEAGLFEALDQRGQGEIRLPLPLPGAG